MAGARRCSRRAPSTYQPACKPGSVRRRANPPRDGHSSGTPVTRRLQQPTRTADRRHSIRDWLPRRPYSVLLPVGFAVPLPSPETRCALTAPFHPCRLPRGIGRSTLCGTFPGLCPRLRGDWSRRTLSGTACPWSPDFPLKPAFRHWAQAAVRPTDGERCGTARRPRQGRRVGRVKPRAPTSRCVRGRSSCATCACRARRARPGISQACRTDFRPRACARRRDSACPIRD